jgi:hypothetical protein
MVKYIKLITKQTRIEKEKKIVNGEEKIIEKEILLNNVVDFYDHNGRLRHMTEDEIRSMCKHFPKVLEELNKELKK